MKRGSLLTMVILLVGGCTLEPHYRRPDLPVQAVWPDGVALTSGRSTTATADIGWREFFTDAATQRLIQIALLNSRDARIAALNVAAARAQYRIQRADLFPAITASAVEEAERYPAGVAATAASSNTSGTGGSPAATTAASAAVGASIFRYYDVGIGFTAYELDLFGRIRSLDHQKLEQYFGYVETQRSAQITLVAAVANAWLSVLADEELLEQTTRTLESQQASYDLIKLSYDHGVLTALVLRQAETSVDSAAANLALYKRQLAQDRNALALLLGAPIPSDLPLGPGLDGDDLVDDLPTGLPSDLMTRRPDILAAERDLRAANANIGAARAAFFPSISLTGSFGTASGSLSGLFKDGSSTWTFAPQISIPIFAGGANLANLDLAKTERNLYVAQYEKAVQTAFREVSDALVARTTFNDQLAAQAKLESASLDAYRLSELRFRNGVDSYLDVLDSQRSLYAAQMARIGVRLSQQQNRVTLYKVLGGGWKENSPAGSASRESPTPATDLPANGAATAVTFRSLKLSLRLEARPG